MQQKNRPSSSIEHKLYLAASHWAGVRKEENIRLKEGGNKRCLRNQPKYVQKCKRSQGVEDARRQLYQEIETEISERKQQEMKSTKYSGLAHSHASLPTTARALIPTLRTRKWHDQIKQKEAEFIHRAEALYRCISLDQGEETTKYQVGRQGGQKKKMATGEREREKKKHYG